MKAGNDMLVISMANIAATIDKMGGTVLEVRGTYWTSRPSEYHGCVLWLDESGPRREYVTHIFTARVGDGLESDLMSGHYFGFDEVSPSGVSRQDAFDAALADMKERTR